MHSKTVAKTIDHRKLLTLDTSKKMTQLIENNEGKLKS